MSRAHSNVFFVFVPILALAACAADSSSTGECAVTQDCAEGYLCKTSVCQIACNQHAECEPAQICSEGSCTPATDPQCATHEDCRGPGSCEDTSGATCVGGRCDYRTSAAGALCNDQDACTSEDACTVNGVCGGTSNGMCDQPCSDDTGCASGWRCTQGVCAPKIQDGEACAESADCTSGHCEAGTCCAPGGECCLADSDCSANPGSRSCLDVSPQTDCQGTRTGASCLNFSCVPDLLEDDRACAGLNRECPDNLRPVACPELIEADPPVCPSACGINADCVDGYVCDFDGACVVPTGVGEMCSGTGASTCGAGLHCANGVCCAQGQACCQQSAHCSGELACNGATSTCEVTCNNYDTSQCAHPQSQYCLGETCRAQLELGQTCQLSDQCLLGACVDGVCCDSACEGSCQSCVSSADGAVVGLCSAVQNGEPDDTCYGSIGCSGDDCVCNGEQSCELGIGEGCASPAECASGRCECADAECASAVCALQVCSACAFTPDGFSCSGTMDAGAPNPGSCDGEYGCFAGACLGGDGAPCIDDTECGATCLIDSCGAPSPLDGPCDSDFDCDGSLQCSGAVCLRPDGEACEASSECVNGCYDGFCFYANAFERTGCGADGVSPAPGVDCDFDTGDGWGDRIALAPNAKAVLDGAWAMAWDRHSGLRVRWRMSTPSNNASASATDRLVDLHSADGAATGPAIDFDAQRNALWLKCNDGSYDALTWYGTDSTFEIVVQDDGWTTLAIDGVEAAACSHASDLVVGMSWSAPAAVIVHVDEIEIEPLAGGGTGGIGGSGGSGGSTGNGGTGGSEEPGGGETGGEPGGAPPVP